VLAPGFYARKDVKTPVVIGIASLVLGVLSNFIFVPLLGLAALPMSTALSAWINALVLYALLHARGHYALKGDVAFRVGRQLIAAAAMGALLWFLTGALEGWMAQSRVFKIVGLGAMMAAGGTAYFALGWVIGAINKDDVLILLRRKKASSQ
jgi:putative peptidoglycan lipid II flippase